jgi:3-(3-hydroxy-phenyl)propionate hydroxylase
MADSAPEDGLDVLVVGLGPVGSLLALLLGEAGVRVLAIDRRPEPYPLPRAVATDDEVLRILRALPDGQEIVESMLRDCLVELVGRDGRPLTRIRFPGSGPQLPGLATFHQPTLERQLGDRLAGFPSVAVRRGVAVVDVCSDRSGVEVLLDCDDTLHARYVVGCDGAGSAVRRLAGIAMRGRRFAEPWLVVDVAGSGGEKPSLVRFSCDVHRPAVRVPLPGARRFEFLLRPDEVAAASTPGASAPYLASAGVPAADAEVVRSAVYTFSAQVAQRWRAGRLLLAGDAAHVMPPFAGQGLSAGLRDAAALAWRLELVVRGAAGEGLLDGYQAERHPHVRTMTRLALFLGGVVQTRHPTVATLRDRLFRIADATPGLGRWLRAGGPRVVSRLPRAARLPGRRAGQLLPVVDVEQDGSSVPLDLLLGRQHALIATDDAFLALSRATREAWERVGVRRIVLQSVPAGAKTADADCPVVVASVKHCDLSRLLRRRVLLVRPDRYVLAAVPPHRLEEVSRRYLSRLGGP